MDYKNPGDAAKDLKQQVESTTDKIADAAKDTADKTLRGAEDALKATKDMANDAMDAAEDKVKKLRDNAEPLVGEFASKAQDFANRGIEYCAHSQARIKQRVEDCCHATTDYVQSQPGKSMLMAVAGGMALAATLMALTRRRY